MEAWRSASTPTRSGCRSRGFPRSASACWPSGSANRPLVLDVDDHELSFFDVDDGLDLGELRKLSGERPRAAVRTGVDPRVRAGDRELSTQRTVSNVALQERYGGLLVPHARDERRFDPARYDRDAGRGPTRCRSVPTACCCSAARPGSTRASSRCSRPSTDSATPATSSRSFGTGELAKLGDRVPAPRAVDRAVAVPALRRAGTDRRRRRPVVRAPGPRPTRSRGTRCRPRSSTRWPWAFPASSRRRRRCSRWSTRASSRSTTAEPLHERIAAIFADPDDARDRAGRVARLFLEEYSCEAVCERVAPWFEQLIADPPGAPGRRWTNW